MHGSEIAGNALALGHRVLRAWAELLWPDPRSAGALEKAANGASEEEGSKELGTVHDTALYHGVLWTAQAR